MIASTATAFDSEFLAALAVAFQKRRKALKHKTRSSDCNKVYELIGAEKVERLELYLDLWHRRVLRLHAWPDRLLWLDARLGSKSGWLWEWTYDGRLIGGLTASDVIESLEETSSLVQEMTAERTPELTAVWKRKLARGPSVVT